jgi:hypothetical protein
VIVHPQVLDSFSDEMVKIAFTPRFNAKVISRNIDAAAALSAHTHPAYAKRVQRIAEKNVVKSLRQKEMATAKKQSLAARPTTKAYGEADANLSAAHDNANSAYDAFAKARRLTNP